MPSEIVDTTDGRVCKRVKSRWTEVERCVCTCGAAISERDCNPLALIFYPNLTAAEPVLVGVGTSISREYIEKMLADRSNEVSVLVSDTTGAQTGTIVGSIATGERCSEQFAQSTSTTRRI